MTSVHRTVDGCDKTVIPKGRGFDLKAQEDPVPCGVYDPLAYLLTELSGVDRPTNARF